jgi:hypothetical protein
MRHHYVVLMDGQTNIGTWNCHSSIRAARRTIADLRRLGDEWRAATTDIQPCSPAHVCYGCHHNAGRVCPHDLSR